jgi:hypothetical protein
VRCRCWGKVDLGRQILCECSRTDENGNGNLARAVSIASSTGLRSIFGVSGEWLPFGRKTEPCEHIWSPSCMPQRPSQARVQDRRGWNREPSLHPKIEDDWLLVHQAIDPKCPNLTSFFPKKGKGDREKALNSLSGFDCGQPS